MTALKDLSGCSMYFKCRDPVETPTTPTTTRTEIPGACVVKARGNSEWEREES